MRVVRSCTVLVVVLAVVTAAWATHLPYNGNRPMVAPQVGPGVPRPSLVPGKEYCDHLDENFNHLLDAMQVLRWDGEAAVVDTYDYDGVDDETGEQVDALANGMDTLFHSLIDNTSALLFSVTGDGNIYYETIIGTGGMWASGAATGPPYVAMQDHINHIGVEDVDGLEVWGPDDEDNANRYSKVGDPGRVAIFILNPAGPDAAAYTSAHIANAIGHPELEDDIDLDALMMWSDQIIFSIAPVGPFDGGEIWVWDAVNPAAFLNHGGHLWDTAFDVMGTFGLNNENVNAIEAVPEPATISLLGLGAVALIRRRRA